jgi:hypothetical protein
MYPQRLQKIFALGAGHNVEIETHPARDEEYAFLKGGDADGCLRGVKTLRGYRLRVFDPGAGAEVPIS